MKGNEKIEVNDTVKIKTTSMFKTVEAVIGSTYYLSWFLKNGEEKFGYFPSEYIELVRKAEIQVPYLRLVA